MGPVGTGVKAAKARYHRRIESFEFSAFPSLVALGVKAQSVSDTHYSNKKMHSRRGDKFKTLVLLVCKLIKGYIVLLQH